MRIILCSIQNVGHQSKQGSTGEDSLPKCSPVGGGKVPANQERALDFELASQPSLRIQIPYVL